MANSPRRPVPGRIWGVLAAMVLVALLCLMLALVLGSRLRALGPERGGAREGYTQVVKPSETDGAANSAEGRTEEAQLAALMNQQGPFVTPTATVLASTNSSTTAAAKVAPSATEAAVPMEMPQVEMQATELPPVAAASESAPLPASTAKPLEVKPQPDAPLWQKNAVSVPVAPGAPMMALVIDDMGGQDGFQMAGSRRAVEELPEGVTMSFFPWSKLGVALAHEAHGKGHEIMIHMPMEALPHGSMIMDPGPDTLRVGMTPDEIEKLLRRNIDNLSDIAVGMNNHMGSRFTEWEPGVRAVLTVLQSEGMLFLDSKTAAPTATADAAKGLTLPVLTREVFLDHTPTPEAIKAELNKAMVLARKHGSVIVIGHPLPLTLDVLHAEMPQLVSSGIVLVPLTMLVK